MLHFFLFSFSFCCYRIFLVNKNIYIVYRIHHENLLSHMPEIEVVTSVQSTSAKGRIAVLSPIAGGEYISPPRAPAHSLAVGIHVRYHGPAQCPPQKYLFAWGICIPI